MYNLELAIDFLVELSEVMDLFFAFESRRDFLLPVLALVEKLNNKSGTALCEEMEEV